MEAYEKFKASNFKKVRGTWLGLLNVVMAMGSSLNPDSKLDAPTRVERSRAFYERAVKLAAKSSVRGPSLDIVQYLLLASQYLQGTQKSSQTWTLHGLAVKGAFALGLHSNQASQQFSRLENEIRKRTWFGCILLDRVLSMTFGRPPIIPEDFIRLPLAVPWPDIHTAKYTCVELQQSSMDFFNNSLTLHRLIGKAIAWLYGQNLGYDAISESESIPRTFELEQELRQWQSHLPRELPIVVSNALPMTSSLANRIVGRFRVMLTLRYHNLYILVHRPLLCKSLDFIADALPNNGPDPTVQMAKSSIDACLGSAEETIDIVHGILTDPSLGSSILGAWWFTLYYLFNGSLVIFSNSLLLQGGFQQAQGGQQQAPRSIAYLETAVNALRLLDKDNRIVERCTEYVEYLLKILERRAQHNREPGSDSGRGVGPQFYQGFQNGLAGAPGGIAQLHPDESLADFNDFFTDDLELAQFFASGIFDMQSSADTVL